MKNGKENFAQLLAVVVPMSTLIFSGNARINEKAHKEGDGKRDVNKFKRKSTQHTLASLLWAGAEYVEY